MQNNLVASKATDQDLTSLKSLKKILLDYRQMKQWVKEPFIVVEGDGVKVRDIKGKWYMDAYSGVYAVNAGHGNQRILNALKGALDKFVFQFPMNGTNIEAIRLANLLSEIAPGNLKSVKLLTGGSESNEGAMKMVRQYHKLTGNPRKYKIISFYDSYQGATFGAMSATGFAHLKQNSEPFLEGFIHVLSHNCYRCPFGHTYPGCNIVCADVVEQTILKEDPDTVAAMIIEPVIQIQGAMTPPREYLPRIREICRRHNVILIFDEIITGFGRTGELFGALTFDTIPDIIVCGKGMSSGYAPLSACLIDDRIAEAFWSDSEDVSFMHGHTYGCHMLSAVAGIAATQELIEKDLPGNARLMEAHVKEGFKNLDEKYGIFGDIRGKGLIVCGEIVKNKETKEAFPREMKIGKKIAAASLKNGLIQRAEPHWIAVGPPLTATETDIKEIFSILDKSIGEVLRSVS